MNVYGLVSMALEGLLRKKGRNILTALGIVIAILSLTLVISAGEGMNSFLESELRQEENMRQVAVNPGFGVDMGDFLEEVTVEGEMSEEKRLRLKRAIMNRRRPHPRAGRKTKIIDDEALDDILKVPHVASVVPIVMDRFDARCGDKISKSILSFGLVHDSDRYRKRLIAGSYFTGADELEVLVHEYLLYTWKVTSDEAQAGWVGKYLDVVPVGGSSLMDMFGTPMGGGGMPVDIERLLRGVDLSAEDKAALARIAMKVMDRRTSDRPAAEGGGLRLRIVGVIRDHELKDGFFNILEDGNSMSADIFMPLGLARTLYKASRFNSSSGYTRAIASADASENAQDIQKELQKQGYIAVSVGAMLDQMDTVITGLTIFQSFMTGIIMVVAALGIMTTMITSVVERTREIGIWKAVGASNRQVLAVFLTESGFIGVFGSLTGLLMARLLMFPGNALGSWIIERETAMPFAGDVMILPLWVVLLAPLFATAIAVCAALYPAFRGARIDPVAALRNE